VAVKAIVSVVAGDDVVGAELCDPTADELAADAVVDALLSRRYA
jgi:hypothetical protein